VGNPAVISATLVPGRSRKMIRPIRLSSTIAGGLASAMAKLAVTGLAGQAEYKSPRAHSMADLPRRLSRGRYERDRFRCQSGSTPSTFSFDVAVAEAGELRLGPRRGDDFGKSRFSSAAKPRTVIGRWPGSAIVSFTPVDVLVARKLLNDSSSHTKNDEVRMITAEPRGQSRDFQHGPELRRLLEQGVDSRAGDAGRLNQQRPRMSNKKPPEAMFGATDLCGSGLVPPPNISEH
jgi:hypothetical protein